MDLKRVEHSYFTAALLMLFVAIIFARTNPLPTLPKYIDLGAVFFSVSFGVLTLQSWKMYSRLILEKEKPRKTTWLRMLAFIALKLFLFGVLLIFVISSSRKSLISFAGGFTVFLFLGILLAAIPGFIARFSPVAR